MADTVQDMETDGAKIDEALYSRQLYVLGHEAMRKMMASSVLIVGLRGLGVEIAKNVVLGGVKSVTLYDPAPATLADLSAQFFLREEDVGKRRATATAPRLAELNQYVPVAELEGDLTADAIASFGIVVVTGAPLGEATRINEACRKSGGRFILADTYGLFGGLFCDFGAAFEVVDADGEEPVSGMLTSVSQDEEGIVTMHDETRHGLSDGDHVCFTEVQGMTELNGSGSRPIKVLGPFSFSIGDTSGYGAYTSGGYMHQVKQKQAVSFLPLPQALAAPDFLVSDFAKFERPMQLHLGFQALDAYRSAHGQLPPPSDADAAAEVLTRARELPGAVESLGAAGSPEAEASERLLRNLASGARGELAPMCAIFGGMAAQEVMKAASGKFMPLKQWLYFDAEECLPADGKEALPPAETAPRGSRYDSQAAALGWSTQEKLGSLRYLLVGAGAIGCEMLKNWAMMGIGCGEGGHVTVTDPDTIEKSNLNRQFLFRPWDVTKAKSACAAAAIGAMNPAAKVEARLDRVGAETEGIFDDAFWGRLSGVCNALDNVQARLYVDQRCIYYQKSLLESGTLGPKGNVQVVVPKLTESYGSSRDPPEKSIPVCTLKNFPNQIEHTIQWSRDCFEGLFRQGAEDVNAYLSQPDFLSNLERQPGVRKTTLEALAANLVDKPISLEQCVVWARLRFEELFHNQIAQLIFNFPLDMATSSGAPFWSGPKRPPTPLQFSADDPLHLGFIIAAANLRAFNYGLKGSTDPALFKKAVEAAMVPEFVPKQGVKIATDPKEAEKAPAAPPPDEDEASDAIVATLPAPSSLAGYRMTPVDFEKDDDTNFHIDFIAAASNLRARNYKITEADHHRTKQIAGKIIPAIATTTSLVTGLVCLELLKLMQPAKPIESFKNGFVNLALPFVSFSEPIAAPKRKIGAKGAEWTLWDRYEVDEGRELTLKEFLAYFQERHKLEVTMISSGVSILYSFFTNQKKLKERMPMTMSQLVQEISKAEFKPTQNSLTFEICCNDEDDEDVEVPFVQYKFRGW